MTRTVADLIAALEEFPGYWPVAVEVIVGGDIGTDETELLEVTSEGMLPRVLLVPADIGYEVRGLIDEGLAARAALEAGP